jgi:hypothetical protein
VKHISATTPDGRAVRCKKGDPTGHNYNTVHRYTNGKLHHYPNPTIASAWDKNWVNAKVIPDCTGVPYGFGLGMPIATDGESIKCDNSAAIYRYTGGRLRVYPNPTVAAKWNKNWWKTRTANCINVPYGPPM